MNERIATVVVPSYGRQRQLRACLDALVGQSFAEPWEVVVVDDGSPEPHSPLVTEFAGRLDLRVIRQDNAGPAAARNRGVNESLGEFVAFTDDDCLPSPTWLETLVRAARGRPDSLVGGTTVNGVPEDLFASTSQLIVDWVYEHFNADSENAYFLASNNILCPRGRFLSLGGFDAAFRRAGAEDRDFCDRWRMAGWPIVWRPDARVEHRHSQTFRQFIDLHYRYGRGAHRYQAVRRRRRSGSMSDDMAFHLGVVHRLRSRLAAQKSMGERTRLLGALAAWQVANAAGFGVEALATIWRRGG